MKPSFSDTFEYKLIYIFKIQYETHKGLLKIGEATLKTDLPIPEIVPNCSELNKAAKQRINQYTATAGIKTELLYTELAVKEVKTRDGKSTLMAFSDHDVHDVLKRSYICPEKPKGSETGREWFRVDLKTAISAIKAVKDGKQNLSGTKSSNFVPIDFRPEQIEAIEQTKKQFKTGNDMLWNAKMRFGKTLTALELIRQMKYRKSIIITHRPVVNEGWYQDFSKIFGDPDIKEEYVYGSKSNGYDIDELIKMDKPFVYFASIQDLRGSEAVGGKYDKNSDAFSVNWDLVIVDEAHEGTTTSLGDSVIRSIVKADSSSKTKLLSLSGTPFNILDKYESNIYTWDYMMEQHAKRTWSNEHFGDSNPYSDLPTLQIYTYDLGDILSKPYLDVEDKAFNFKEFFRVRTNENNKNNEERFYHEDDVRSFLDLITKDDESNNYPYSNEKYRELFKHSLWVVPGVKEAKALSKMMRKHPVFGCGAFNIVNVAGEGDDESSTQDALKKVKDAIRNSEGKYTITLSCGRLTTGVTVSQWTAVFMLAGSYSTSPASYLQTIFRVQSPCNENGKVKTCGYVFDFAPDRTLKMVAESVAVSSKAGKADNNDREIMGEFLNYCPVISIYGSEMTPYDANRLLQQLKRAYAEKAVRNGFDDTNLYNDELLKLDKLDLAKFEELKGIVGSSKASHKIKDIDINNQGLTNEQYEIIKQIEKKAPKERTPEEIAKLEKIKEQKKQRGNAISILRAISIRMPLLIYGADVNIDEDITIEGLVEKIDDTSWEEFMPKGVDKSRFKEFIKYYDPDIFVAAGKRIRNIAKAADVLEPTERIKKITKLFSCFKNPDKETVLTPWRVVNLHISDCLGGYDFYDENHENEIDAPRYVDQGKVTGDTLSNCDAKILEINSKSGLYPLYATYSIYRAKCKRYDTKALTSEIKNKLWEETVKNNIFVICKTKMAKYITRRTLVGFKDASINAHYFDDLIGAIKHKQEQFIEKIKKPSYWKMEEGKTMKFDAVIGNPPYQECLDHRSEQPPLYHLFYNVSMEVSGIITLITPARFLFGVGKTPEEWNDKMLNNEHFKVVDYFANSKDVFDTVDIKGGVAVGYINKNEKFGAIKVFVPDVMLKNILIKVNSKCSIDISSIIYSNTSYKYTDLFFKDNKNFRERVSGGSLRYLSSSVFDKFPEVFLDSKPDDNEVYIRILGRQDNLRKIKYFNKRYINPPDNFDKYKMYIASSNGSGNFGEALSEPILGEPYVGSTETFLSFGSFDTRKEAENIIKYIKTRFARLLLGTKKVTQGNKNPKIWSNIPLQDFTVDSDINWDCPIDEIDEQLFRKYSLSDEEIKYINDRIKPM